MTAVVQAPANPALALLATLGDTAEKVAASLAARGVTGRPNSCGRCPVANLLLAELTVLDVAVLEAEIEVVWADTGSEFLPTPKPIADFVVRFDHGAFDQLVAFPGGDR